MKSLWLGIAMICGLAFADIYKWKDAHGVTHFSDQPHQGAERLTLDTESMPTPPEQTPTESAQETKPAEQQGVQYQRLEIIEPKDKATIRNNDGNLTVQVATEPELSKNDNVQIFLDGNPLGNPSKGLAFSITQIDRGEHHLQAKILDKELNMVKKESEKTTFYMHRPKIDHKN